MQPKYIDIHSHVNFKVFEEDQSAVLHRALDNNTWIINSGTQVSTSKKALEIANKYAEGVYATVGLHPIHTDKSFHDTEELGEEGGEFTSRGEVFDKNIYREFLKDKKVVGVGECGLDYFHLVPGGIEKQKRAFIEQIELANEMGKPLVLHIRDAYTDALEILKEHLDNKSLPAGRQGVVHFFAGNLAEAKSFIDFGFYLSFTGVITFPPRKDGLGSDYGEIIKNIPLDMILTDTDSPYLAPIPFRGKRNEPVHVRQIVKKIAEIKGLPEEEVAQAVILNAKRLFDI